jgi:hypothetical protein
MLFAKYRCRNCNAQFTDSAQMGPLMSARIMEGSVHIEVTTESTKVYNLDPIGPNVIGLPTSLVHKCSEKEAGLAELVGFQKERL